MLKQSCCRSSYSLYYFTFNHTIIPTISKITKISAIGIHKGANTNNQDHVITPHNFNTMRATNKIDSTPGP